MSSLSNITISEDSPDSLDGYARIPSVVLVREVFDIVSNDAGISSLASAPRQLAAPFFGLAALALMIACSDSPSRTSTTVVDSSGVKVTISPDADRQYAYVDSAPTLTLGEADAGPAHEFFNIHGVYVDPGRNIWVANRGSNELRIFRPDGSHWKTIGRSGDGPGEFRLIRLLGPISSDRVALWDDRNPRLTMVTGQGVLDSVAVINAGGAVPHADAALRDGGLLVRFPRSVAAASLVAGAVITDTSSLFRYDVARDALTRLITVSGPSWIWTGRHQVPVPFTIKSAFAVDSASALHVAEGAEFRIRVVESGVTTESYGVDRPARAATDAYRDLYRAFYRTHMTDALLLDAYLSGLDHPALPARLPAYSQVLVDNAGRTWAQIYSPDLLEPAKWDIYDAGRQLLGSATTPSGLIVTSIVDGSVIGVWRDELGVEQVRLHRFTTR